MFSIIIAGSLALSWMTSAYLFYLLYALKFHPQSKKMTMKEARNAIDIARPGDIGLSRVDDYWLNRKWPGVFKHAWVVVHNRDCVEATPSGIVRHDALMAAHADYLILLRPIYTKKPEVDNAISRAIDLVGSSYNFNPKTSCTDVATRSWYDSREKLRMSDRMISCEIPSPDDFIRTDFGIIWMSDSVTIAWAEKEGLHPEALRRIREFKDGIRDFNSYGNPVVRNR